MQSSNQVAEKIRFSIIYETDFFALETEIASLKASENEECGDKTCYQLSRNHGKLFRESKSGMYLLQDESMSRSFVLVLGV